MFLKWPEIPVCYDEIFVKKKKSHLSCLLVLLPFFLIKVKSKGEQSETRHSPYSKKPLLKARAYAFSQWHDYTCLKAVRRPQMIPCR